MSVPVPLLRLRAAIEERGARCYLVTVCDDASPHAVHAPVRWEGDVIVADVGKRSAANAVARPSVSLLFSSSPCRRSKTSSISKSHKGMT